MSQSIKMGGDTYWDANDVIINSSTASSRKTLQEFAAYVSTTTNITVGSVTAVLNIYRKFWTTTFIVSVGDSSGTPFSTINSGDIIGTIPEGYRPVIGCQVTGLMRSSSVWASATYLPVYIAIATNGEIAIRGNETQMRTMKYLVFSATFTVAG